MVEPTEEQRTQRSSGWPPWWLYLVVIIAANAIRQLIAPRGDLSTAMDMVVAVAFSAVVATILTVVYRVATRRRR